MFANGGYRVNPLLISRITDTKGHVLNEARAPALDESMRTIDARNAFVMTSLLQEVTRSGTAAKAQAHAEAARHLRQDRHHQRFARRLVRRLAARTSSPSSGWATTTPRKLGDRETGGGLSLPVWIDYMSDGAEGRAGAGADARPKAWSTSAASGTTRSTRAAPASAASASRTRRAPTPPSEEERNSILDLFRKR